MEDFQDTGIVTLKGVDSCKPSDLLTTVPYKYSIAQLIKGHILQQEGQADTTAPLRLPDNNIYSKNLAKTVSIPPAQLCRLSPHSINTRTQSYKPPDYVSSPN